MGMGAQSTFLRRAVVLLSCAALAGVAAQAPAARGTPRPEPAHRSPPATLRPDAVPGSSARSSATQNVPATSQPRVSGSTVRTTTPPPASVVSSSPRVRVERRLTPPTAKKSTASRRPPQPSHAHAAALSLRGPRLAPSHGSSFLLFAGLLLALLVVGETTFLRLAASRFAIADPGRRARRPVSGAPYPIRRVF
jgi:hypothetical protein